MALIEEITLAFHQIHLEVAEAASQLLHEAATVAEEFSKRFLMKQSTAARGYNCAYREGSRTVELSEGSEKPELSGELFPGRPFCRP